MSFFDVPLLLLTYEGWIFGLVMMVHFHNMFVSIFLYKARQTNVSNIFKIIFNFGGLFVYICNLWGLVVPIDVTLNECKGVVYTLSLANNIHKGALSAFLLWRLRQVESKKTDYWLSIFLFCCKVSFHFAQFFVIKPEVRFDEDENAFFCIFGFDANKVPLMGVITFDFIIDFYVTFRLVQVLNRANRNALQISSNITRKTKRSLFTAVIYWNFIRLFFAISYNIVILFYTVLGFYKAFNPTISASFITSQALFAILLSYSITADAEIVRVIEGQNKNGYSSNSAGTGKSFKNTSEISKTNQPPKYSAGSYSFSKNEKQESDDIGENKIAVVSMKRLSFFEWANAVVGNKVSNDNDIVDEERDIEINEGNDIEIVQEIADEVADNSYSNSNNQNRDSSFSGITTITTTTSSTSDDDDIV